MTTDSPVLAVKDENAFLNDQAQSMRAGVYEFLGRLLASPPSEDVLQVLRDIEDVDASEGQVAMGGPIRVLVRNRILNGKTTCSVA